MSFKQETVSLTRASFDLTSLNQWTRSNFDYLLIKVKQIGKMTVCSLLHIFHHAIAQIIYCYAINVILSAATDKIVQNYLKQLRSDWQMWHLFCKNSLRACSN